MPLILRECGSGTRAVFEQLLWSHNYEIDAFPRRIVISSFELTKKLVRQGAGISFVYAAIADSDPALATFEIDGAQTIHEFNYVFLKDTQAEDLIPLLEG